MVVPTHFPPELHSPSYLRYFAYKNKWSLVNKLHIQIFLISSLKLFWLYQMIARHIFSILIYNLINRFRSVIVGKLIKWQKKYFLHWSHRNLQKKKRKRSKIARKLPIYLMHSFAKYLIIYLYILRCDWIWRTW